MGNYSSINSGYNSFQNISHIRDKFTPVVIIYCNKTYKFYETDKLNKSNIGNKISTIIDTNSIIRSLIKNKNNGEYFVVYYKVDSVTTNNDNPIGIKLSKYIRCNCSYHKNQSITGPIGFIKYKNDNMVDFTKEDIKWIASL